MQIVGEDLKVAPSYYDSSDTEQRAPERLYAGMPAGPVLSTKNSLLFEYLTAFESGS